jgi:antirestriction protein ArdC
MTTAQAREDLHATVTAAIVAQLEAGARPWLQNWSAGSRPIHRPRRSCGERYRGVNVLWLWCVAEERGYRSDCWVTFKQALDLGGHVRNGEKGTKIVYYNTLEKESTNDAGETTVEKIPLLKTYTVFNADQCEGLPESFYAPAGAVYGTEPIPVVAELAKNSGAEIVDGPYPCYRPTLDQVVMPATNRFRDDVGHASTLLHELAHWTARDGRCSRPQLAKKFGDDAYAMEELVAELAAAFLCADLGISAEPREDHAGYLASWIAVLKADSRAIFTAAAAAGRAAEYLAQFAPQPVAATVASEQPAEESQPVACQAAA